jgi:hypothetical protein
LQQAENRVSGQPPDDLRQLYLTSDGVWNIAGQWFDVWPLGATDRCATDLADENEWSETALLH